jgi:hypothetical protein
MKHWRLALVIVVLLAAAGAFTYGGLHTLSLAHGGPPARAKILSCRGGGGRTACQGVWTASGQVGSGMVEGASYDDIGKEIDVVVSGERAWVKRTAAGVGGTALFFAALCLVLAISLPLSLRAERRRAAAR